MEKTSPASPPSPLPVSWFAAAAAVPTPWAGYGGYRPACRGLLRGCDVMRCATRWRRNPLETTAAGAGWKRKGDSLDRGFPFALALVMCETVDERDRVVSAMSLRDTARSRAFLVRERPYYHTHANFTKIKHFNY
uniref:Uncharacterized protein n=1 Tax=Oryza nivara TaxID=4536 RepID=A0A0E0FL04_ORYNI